MAEIATRAPRPHGPAFATAAFFAPIVILCLALPFEGLRFIAGMAILFGGLCYLLLGLPALWMAIGAGIRHPLALMLVGVVSNLGSPILAALWFNTTQSNFHETGAIIHVYLTLGSVFAALWSLAFGLIYVLLDRV